MIARHFAYSMAVGAMIVCASTSSSAPRNDTPALELPSWTASSIQDSVKRFSRVKRNWRCFDMILSFQQNVITIEFVPPNDTLSTNDSIIINASKCGRGAVFTYSIDGIKSLNFIR